MPRQTYISRQRSNVSVLDMLDGKYDQQLKQKTYNEFYSLLDGVKKTTA